MATYDNAYLSVGGTDLSSYLQALDISHGAETNDDTVMGDSYRSGEGGLKTRVVTATLVQSWGSGGPDFTLNSLLNTAVAVITAPEGSTPGVSNPTTTQTMTCTEYVDHSGTVGDLQLCRVTFVAAGAAVRATA